MNTIIGAFVATLIAMATAALALLSGANVDTNVFMDALSDHPDP